MWRGSPLESLTAQLPLRPEMGIAAILRDPSHHSTLMVQWPPKEMRSRRFTPAPKKKEDLERAEEFVNMPFHDKDK